MMKHAVAFVILLAIGRGASGAEAMTNDLYRLDFREDGAVALDVKGMAPRLLVPEFTVIWSGDDPHILRNPSHPDYVTAPRTAVRWKAAAERSRPFETGNCVTMKPARVSLEPGGLQWLYAPQAAFNFSAAVSLPPADRDILVTFSLTPARDGFFSVAFTGAPDAPLADTLAVPQECEAHGHRQFDFVMSEADLHLPRAHLATKDGNIALAAGPAECRFRLPTLADSRFGFMLASDGGRLKPVLLAPLPGGSDSRMKAGQTYSFSFHCVIRPGDWKDTYTHIARDLHGFRDQRDNSGPGPLNGTLERVMEFLAGRNGRNFAMWDPQQKYYDYFTDKTGVFKPFSPLYGLSAAIVTDDEEFFRNRARPAVEYALSRRSNLFAPYDAADNKQARRATRELGAPYLGREQLESLDGLFQHRTPAFRAWAEAAAPARGPGRVSGGSEEGFFNLLERANATHDAHDIEAVRDAAYHQAARLNLCPVPPDAVVTVDRSGVAPVHAHSIGRHKNIWGFPPPQPLPVPGQTVPSWRIARLGLPAPAYPIEYWMNTHGALMRTAGLAHDGFLRDVARWGMVGRFGNYPGDNRSQDSLVAELPNAVDRPPWQWNFATVNPGHAWDFAGAVIDFLVSDAFERSGGAIDFPASSAAGSNFRVGIYGARPGRFYGDERVRLWLPRGLLVTDNRQLDWIAGYGNGRFYLALLNQSFREERATVIINRELVECGGGSNRLAVTVPPKGIAHFAMPAVVKPRLQAKLYETNAPPLPAASFAGSPAPFGGVHASLLRAGRGLTSAFVYTDALPENVIAARLLWRQGEGPWQQMTDDIYPYEFSPDLRDEAGDFQCVLEIEDARQKLLRSSVISLAAKEGGTRSASAPPGLEAAGGVPVPSPAVGTSDPLLTDDFIAYFQRAANGNEFGLRADGRFYPYSTPLGRRVAWRQAVWDKNLFAEGCTREEADQRLRAEAGRTLAGLRSALAARPAPVDYQDLDRRQRETLLDFALTEGIAGLREEFATAVLAGDWARLVNGHLYVRYAGQVPDHARNNAFVSRWKMP